MNLRYIATWGLVIFLFAACKQNADTDTAATKKLITDHFNYINTHNLHALRTQYDDRAVISSPVMEGYQNGPLGADEIFHFTFFKEPKTQYVVNTVSATDSSAVVQYEVRGIKRNDPNAYFIYTGCSIFKIKNGKITSELIYNNPQKDLYMANGRFIR